MKIGIQTWGSRGDIQPFLALADGLQRDGHEVTLVITCVDRPVEEFIPADSKINIVSVASPVLDDREHWKQLEKTVFDETNPVKQTQAIIEHLLLPAEDAMFEAAEKLCADNDLVIGHFFHYPLNTAALLHQRHYISVTLVHSIIPSAYTPPAGTPNLGKWGNRLAWKLARGILNSKIKPYADRLRTTHHLAAANDLLADVWTSSKLTLLAVSPQLCSPQPDWPDHIQVCGFLSASGTNDNTLPRALDSFLSNGEAPVYITFGSAMGGEREEQTLELLRSAVKEAGVRAIIQAPNGPSRNRISDDWIHYAATTPHARVFPQCRAIVHHGGAGTSQSALLAGKPSVVVAHTSEQIFWGNELARLNVAPKPLQRHKLTAANLAAKIRQAIDSQGFSETAAAIAQAMGQENGVATAVGLVHQRFPE